MAAEGEAGAAQSLLELETLVNRHTSEGVASFGGGVVLDQERNILDVKLFVPKTEDGVVYRPLAVFFQKNAEEFYKALAEMSELLKLQQQQKTSSDTDESMDGVVKEENEDAIVVPHDSVSVDCGNEEARNVEIFIKEDLVVKEEPIIEYTESVGDYTTEENLAALDRSIR